MFNHARFHQNIKILCVERYISIRKLQDVIGVSASYFSNMANAGSYPRLDVILSLMKFFKVSFDELMDGCIDLSE